VQKGKRFGSPLSMNEGMTSLPLAAGGVKGKRDQSLTGRLLERF
jgi:hypothetical protein